MELFTSNNIFVELTPNNLVLIHQDESYNFSIGKQLKLSSENNSFNVQFICQIINSKKISSSGQLLEELYPILTKPKNYCIGCYKKLDYSPDIYTTCGNPICFYKTEELVLDNSLTEYVRENFQILQLLTEFTIGSINSMRYNDVFDPFPGYFLDPSYKKDLIEQKRGSIIKLQLDQNEFDAYNKAKNINLLRDVVKNIDWDKIKLWTNDLEFANGDKDLYHFLRFVIKSCPLNLTLSIETGSNKSNDTKDNAIIYKISHPFYKEKEFEKKAGDNYCYLFHGSSPDCWHSILRNGIKNVSNTSFQFNGAAYGPGIYMSDSYSFAKGYSYKGAIDKIVVGVFQVCGTRDQYKKTNQIFVIAENNLCQLKYLIVTSGKSIIDHSQMINEYFESKLIDKTKIEQSKMKVVGNKKLMTEYNNLIKNNIYKVTLIDSNILDWEVEYFGVKLHIVFPPNYPFSPPFIHVISPRFTNPKLISSDGAICCEYLTGSNWLPAISIESLIVQIYSLIISPNLKSKSDGTYSYDLAIKSYENLAKGNGWL